MVDRTPKAGIDLIAVQVDVQSVFFVTTTVELEFTIFDVAFEDDVEVVVVVPARYFKRVVVGDEDVAVTIDTACGN